VFHGDLMCNAFFSTDITTIAPFFIDCNPKTLKTAELDILPIRRKIVNDLIAKTAAIAAEADTEHSSVIRYAKNIIVYAGLPYKAREAGFHAFSQVFPCLFFGNRPGPFPGNIPYILAHQQTAQFTGIIFADMGGTASAKINDDAA
jgi:hypothetical protein